jgi:N-acetylglucosaminyldiphosphoundecaprenol N-acetyl-beta-D-mannosaminyltransferase
MAATASGSSTPRRVRILDVPVDCVSVQQTLALFEHFVKLRHPHLIISLDASGVVQSQSDPELRELYETADLVTPDSSGILWATKRAGCPLQERVSGVDLVDQVCALSADKGYRIFFLGGEPGVADLAAERMRLRHPGCNIVGTRHGYFPPDSDSLVGEEVAAYDPDFLFVGMGIPRQEKFILGTMQTIRARVAMGVGGSFDVHSGKVRRAPVILQKMKLEWAWRTLQDRKKIGKVMLLPQFMWLVLKGKR